MNDLSVLLVGESWNMFTTEFKGFNNFTFGYYEEAFRPFATALEGFARLTHIPAHLAATKFPLTLDAIKDYDVILFSDIGADTLLLHPDTFLKSQVLPNRLRLIQQYVNQGGGFAMIGGYMSFGGFEGKAHYHATPIEEILPVEIAPYDDRVEAPEGIQPVPTKPIHPIIRGVTGQWPVLLGYNRLKAKPRSEILLKVDKHPLLVVGDYGKGRTAAFSSDMSSHWGSHEFVTWRLYGRFWQQFIAWLSQTGE